MRKRLFNLKSNWMYIVVASIAVLILIPPYLEKIVPYIATVFLMIGCLYSEVEIRRISRFCKNINSAKKTIVIFFCLICSLIITISFYQTWIFSSKVFAIARMIHLSSKAFLLTLSVFGFICTFLMILSIVEILFLLQIDKPLLGRYATFFFVSLYTFICSQVMVCQLITSPGVFRIILNIMLYGVLIIFLDFILKNAELSIILGSLPGLIYATIDNYIYRFRGNELNPLEFNSFQTALNVIKGYNLSIPIIIAICWGGWSLLVLIIRTSDFHDNELKIRWISGTFGILICVLVYICAKGIQAKNWANEGSVFNGNILNLVLKIRDSFPEKPNLYSDYIKDIESQYFESKSNSDSTYDNLNHNKLPSIIVIMDESFTDFSVLGSTLNTDTELLPFLKSMKNNVIKGYAVSSVYGGNTPNSEFEFLTGNSMAFLPVGSVPYQQYINEPQYSILSILHNLNYQCLATHPYYANGWSRPEVYKYFDFDQTSFLKAYPQKDLIRGFVSDQEMFDYIIDQYESRDRDKNFFLFGITMQNHGGYTNEDFETTVHLNYDNEYPEAEQFLSLTQLTDEALSKLIEYFETEEEQVVICFFGDHQPAVEEEFLKEVHGGDFSDLNSEILKYKVPFFVWTNYDIQEQISVETSINYLSNYVFEAASIDLPPYNSFLSELSKTIPSINSLGYYSVSDGRYITIDETTDQDYLAKLNEYAALEYNNIFDKKSLSSIFIFEDK